MLTESTGPIAANTSSSRCSSVVNGRLPTNRLRPIPPTPFPVAPTGLSLQGPDAVRDEGRDRDQLGRPTAAMQHESNGSSIRAEAVASGDLDDERLKTQASLT